MQLGTFGAIMSFAMELEGRAGSFYSAEETRLPHDLREDLRKGANKRWRRLEKARREGVVELALESITGLDSDNYAVEGLPSQVAKESLRQAVALEEVCSRFYKDAALKLPIREIARLFERLAQGNDDNLDRLKTLPNGGSQD